ncbi:GDSL esterase/lipase At1g28650-like [Aristolochia californica]|uniref:GDSL esterase/lipase At1g28650-like n=1 Tax=Aristolochia californica TaxID=171875 RepID=UPI0035D72EEC
METNLSVKQGEIELRRLPLSVKCLEAPKLIIEDGEGEVAEIILEIVVAAIVGEVFFKLYFADCRNVFRSTFFLLGEISGNDLNYPFAQGWSIKQLHSFLPQIVSAIKSAVRVLIVHGATTILVPGNLPIGCSPSNFSLPWNSVRKHYNTETGCLDDFNAFVEKYNQQQKMELDHLRALHSGVTLIYADYYNAAMWVFRSPHEFGFNETLRACCGGGGHYNYNISTQCGLPGSQACKNSLSFVSWDDIHLTEAMYSSVAEALLKGPYTEPSIASVCLASHRPLLFRNEHDVC